MLSSLVDAGCDIDSIVEILNRIPIQGWSIESYRIERSGIAGTKIEVNAPDDKVVRTFSHIVGIIEEARLPETVRDMSLDAFSNLVNAEATVHSKPIEHTHLHEAGGHDTIIDVVGTATALWLLGVDVITSSPIAQGYGRIHSAHGELPNPPPAVVELLTDFEVYGVDTQFELTTPTGAAMLKSWAKTSTPLPHMSVKNIGYGAGTRELGEIPNFLQVICGESQEVKEFENSPLFYDKKSTRVIENVEILETNLDDVTPEVLGFMVQELFKTGALDVWMTPIFMKKGRPAYKLSVLIEPDIKSPVLELIFRETKSLGIRSYDAKRTKIERDESVVTVDGFKIRIKIGEFGHKAEYDDVAIAAQSMNKSFDEIKRLAETLYIALKN